MDEGYCLKNFSLHRVIMRRSRVDSLIFRHPFGKIQQPTLSYPKPADSEVLLLKSRHYAISQLPQFSISPIMPQTGLAADHREPKYALDKRQNDHRAQGLTRRHITRLRPDEEAIEEQT